jgi:hypothetical protein
LADSGAGTIEEKLLRMIVRLVGEILCKGIKEQGTGIRKTRRLRFVG